MTTAGLKRRDDGKCAAMLKDGSRRCGRKALPGKDVCRSHDNANTSADRIRHETKLNQAIDLRVMGFTLRAIGERLGVSKSTVHAMLLEGIATAVDPEARSIALGEYVERCERVMSSMAKSVIAGDPKAASTYLAAAERIAKAFGVADASKAIEADASALAANSMASVAAAAASHVTGLESRLRASGFTDEQIAAVLVAQIGENRDQTQA